jgi:hypothetical protein
MKHQGKHPIDGRFWVDSDWQAAAEVYKIVICVFNLPFRCSAQVLLFGADNLTSLNLEATPILFQPFNN